jgi:hypothetical protein
MEKINAVFEAGDHGNGPDKDKTAGEKKDR